MRQAMGRNWVLALVSCCFLIGHSQVAESGETAQLYLYLSPSPKWGYIKYDETKPNEVQFYECEILKPILVERSKLIEAEGPCQSQGPYGTWLMKYDPRAK